MSTKLDANQVIKNVFDELNDALNILTIIGTPSNTASNLDAEQIWKSVYDETTQSIRVIFI